MSTRKLSAEQRLKIRAVVKLFQPLTVQRPTEDLLDDLDAADKDIARLQTRLGQALQEVTKLLENMNELRLENDSLKAIVEAAEDLKSYRTGSGNLAGDFCVEANGFKKFQQALKKRRDGKNDYSR